MDGKIWKVASYSRLSREDDEFVESNSIISQKEIIRAFVRDREELVIVKEYVDDGYSGVNFDRPGIQELFYDIRSKKVDCLICKDLSRFARNYIEAGRYLEKIFPFMGVRFIAVTDNYDSSGEAGQSDELLLPFRNLLNDFYSRDISIKIRSQLDIKRRNGEFVGAFAKYGYKKDPENKNHLLVDDEAARVVKMIFRFRLQGMSNDRIATKLNSMGILSPMEYKHFCGLNYQSGFRVNDYAAWNAVSVRRILTDEIYLGTLIQHRRGTPNHKVKKEVHYDRKDWVIVEDNHEPIISRSDFQTVQSLLKRDVRVAPENHQAHLFAGMVYCGDCDYCMTRKVVVSHGKKYHYFICSSYKAGNGCSSHSFSEQKLISIVYTLVRDQIDLTIEAEQFFSQTPADIASQKHDFKYDDQIPKLKDEIMRYRDRKQYLDRDLDEGLLSEAEYKEFLDRYERKISMCQQALIKIEEERLKANDRKEQNQESIDQFRRHGNITELSRAVIVNLIDRIVIHDATHIEVFFRFQDTMT